MDSTEDKDMLDVYALHPQAQCITCTDAAIIVELLDGWMILSV